VVQFIGRRHRLAADAIEELRSAIHLKIIDNDYEVLRKLEERCSIRTYLTAVVQRPLSRQPHGRLLDAPEDLPRALEALEQALTLAPDLPEAWFTKAVVLERLQIRQQAREAWTRYLQLDPDSSWSAEARRRLAALDSATVLRPWTEIDRALRDPAVDAAIIREAVARDPMKVRELVVQAILHWAAEAGSVPGDARLGQAQRIIEAPPPLSFPACVLR
jgi:tetratricopeptide (TPR) repeat protein